MKKMIPHQMRMERNLLSPISLLEISDSDLYNVNNKIGRRTIEQYQWIIFIAMLNTVNLSFIKPVASNAMIRIVSMPIKQDQMMGVVNLISDLGDFGNL